MSKWHYFVGKPYPKAYAQHAYAGYKIGVFLDKTIRLKHAGSYDRVIETDFSSPDTILKSIPYDVQADALICTYENYIVAKSHLAEALGVLAPTVKSAEISTDKFLMRKAFEKADSSITPAFQRVSSEGEALAAALNLGYPMILKPTNLVKSLLVLRCANEQELIRNFRLAQQKLGPLYEKQKIYGRQPQLILEQYVEGRTCSIAAFVDREGRPHFCSGIVDLVNASDIGVGDNYIFKRLLPADFDSELSDRLYETAAKGIKALEMTSTPAHVELIYSDSVVKLIEIGARIGGYRPRMYKKSYGIDLLEQEARNALGSEIKLDGERKAYCAVYELFPDTEGLFAGIDGLEDPSIFDYFSQKAKPGDIVGAAKDGHKAAAIVIVAHADYSEFKRLCAEAEQLKVRVSQ